MEESKARKRSPQDYPISHNLAHQPYLSSDLDDLPLEDDANVVPLPPSRAAYSPLAGIDPIVEDPLSPRSTSKRKQTGANKGRPAAAKSKPATPYRTPPSTKQPFADELQHLEELAERINHILAERARKAHIERSQPPSRPSETYSRPASHYPAPTPPQPAVGFSLEDADTESLKVQAKRIRQRLSQLELMMDAAAETSSSGGIVSGGVEYLRSPQSPPQPFHSPDPVYSPAHKPPHHPSNATYQRGEYEAWQAAEELRQLQAQQATGRRDRRDRSSSQTMFDLGMRQWVAQLRRLSGGRMLQLPRKPADVLSDALLWVAVATIVRIASRFVLTTFPFLSPIVTLLMLAPAALAIFLVIFVPKTGWVPFYRLFLVMLGLFIGGKFI